MYFSAVSVWLKNYWETIALILMIVTAASTSISYYAKAETERLVKQEIAEPMKKIDEKLQSIKNTQDFYRQEITKQKIDVERSKEKLIGIEKRLDRIIRILDNDNPSRR